MSDIRKEIKDAVCNHQGDVAANKLDELRHRTDKKAYDAFQDELASLNHRAKTKQVYVVGTHHEGKENFLVFADHNADPKQHHVYLMGKDKKYTEVTVNESSKDDAHRFKPTGKTFDVLPQNATTEKNGTPGVDAPGVRKGVQPGTHDRVTDVMDQKHKNQWHIDCDPNGKQTITLTQYNDKGGYEKRVFSPDAKEPEKMTCTTFKKETKDSSEVQADKDKSKYAVKADGSNIQVLKFGYLDDQSNALPDTWMTSDIINLDGSRSRTNYSVFRDVKETFPAKPVSGVLDGDKIPSQVEINKETNLDGNKDTTVFNLTHKSHDGRQTPIALYTKSDDTSNPPKVYKRLPNGQMKEFEDGSESL